MPDGLSIGKLLLLVRSRWQIRETGLAARQDQARLVGRKGQGHRRRRNTAYPSMLLYAAQAFRFPSQNQSLNPSPAAYFFGFVQAPVSGVCEKTS